MSKLLHTLLFAIISLTVQGQITNGQDTLYGNEWINFGQAYFKITVVEDAMHKIAHQQLVDAGVPTGQIEGSQYQLFHNGGEVPIYTTTNSVFSSNDHIEFYGEKNRSQLDQHLFADPENEMLNPYYSLFSDTSAYFLTWTNAGTPLRFEETENDLTNLPPKEAFYMETHVQEYHNHWTQEGFNNNLVFPSNFNKAEGFCSGFKNISEFTIEPTSPYAAGTQATLSVRYTTNATNHIQQISLNGDIWNTDTFNGIQLRQYENPINNILLENPISVLFRGLVDNNDRQAVSNIILNYPREFNALNSSNFNFNLNASTNKKYIEISGFNNTGGQAFLFDINNKKRILATEENNLIKIAIPPINNSSDFKLVSKDGFESPTSIKPISFIDYSDQQAEYLILSNKKLFDDGLGNNKVAEYAAYRESMEGGSFSTLIIDVEQLYNQFGWGINRHAISIRNFGLFIKKYWDTPAEYMFIIGKGREYNVTRTEAQLTADFNANFYVPTFGKPGSDVLLMSDKGSITPNVAIGRLPVETPEEITIYLNKIKEHDNLHSAPSTIEGRAWMKRVLHLGGGTTVSEQNALRNSLELMGEILEESEFGAEVHGFYKTSTTPIQNSVNDSIFNLINDGVRILTFFGHGGVNSFDYNIDNPNNYNNKGKYPILFSMGCYVGGIHTPSKGISERFVFFEDGAAIAFLASTGAGYISSLSNFSKKAYTLIGDDMYGESLGNILKATNQHFEDTGFWDTILIQQLTLNGDPALQVNIFEGPDYTLDYSSVKLTPSIVNVSADSFNLEFDIVNIGRSQIGGGSINYKIQQELPNGEIVDLITKDIQTPLNREKIKINLPNLGKPSTGLNKLFIEIDTANTVDELPAPMAELNNELTSFTGEKGFPFFVQDNGVVAIYPYEFSIVGNQDVTLTASTYDPLVESQKYIFQLDTIETFDSPFMKQHELVQVGGLLKWSPNLSMNEEEVYYWRVSPDSISQSVGYTWSESSFIYLAGKEGWNQSEYGQYLKNGFDSLKLDATKRTISFISNLYDVRLKNKVFTAGDPPQFVANGTVNNCPWNLPWVPAGIQLLVIDPVAYTNWMTCPGNGEYGSVTTGGNATCTWAYRTNTIGDRENLMGFIEEEIPDGWYVVLYSVQKNVNGDYGPEEWAMDSVSLGKNLFSVLESQGAAQVRQLEQKGAVPYIFMFKKNGGALQEAIADDINGTITVEQVFPEYVTEGREHSAIIGPAIAWNKIEWALPVNFNNETDTVLLSVYGQKDLNSPSTLIYSNVTEKEIDIASVSGAEYPYLQLSFFTKDGEERTATNIDYWRVYYEGVPELAINPNLEYSITNDTLKQAELFSVKYGVENISGINADSLLIKYNIINKNNQENITFVRMGPLQAHESSIVEFSHGTEFFTGAYKFEIEINPNKDQPEQSHLNNFLVDGFYISTDGQNPLIDVSFDGQHIMDCDIVSPTTLITILLENENPYLLLNDTSHINIFIKEPGANTPGKVDLSNDAVGFFPIEEYGANKLKIEIQNDFKEDGTYELLVQGVNAIGNVFAELDYRICFRVINKNSISNFLNYPNPFSTSTRFVYTLTGRDVPTDYKLQIMTVSGKIVKEIDEMELGPLKIGENTSDYAWDGTDTFGDKLATGVYLYRFMINENLEKEREEFEIEEVDKYFKNGIGKMVLIR